MISIFIAYSRYDMDIVDNIVENLELSKKHHILWYYHKTHSDLTMDEIIKKISDVNIFIVFLSGNSINNENVIREVNAAKEAKKIKEYISVIIDNNFDKTLIPNFINNNVINNNINIKTAKEINTILCKYNKVY